MPGRRSCGLALLVTLVLSGCDVYVARQIERPTPIDSRGLATVMGQLDARSGQATVAGARIAYRILRPRDYQATATVASRHAGSRWLLDFQLHVNIDPARARPLNARGSILLLHPWGADGRSMSAWAVLLAQAGYQVLLPDLPGHAGSASSPVGYGPREAVQLRALVAQLRAGGELPGRLWVIGASYGASVGLFMSALGIDELAGVVALEPYVRPLDAIRRAPASGLFGHRWLARWIGPRTMRRAVVRADRRLGIDLAAIDAGDALVAVRRCVLIVGGARDELIDPAQWAALATRSPWARYVEVAGEGHLQLPLRFDRLQQPLLAWLAATPASTPAACPGFTPAPAVSTDGSTPSAAAITR